MEFLYSFMQYCVVYSAGSFDHIEEEGCRETCEKYIRVCEDAYDKPLRIVPPEQVRRLVLRENTVITGYAVQ